MKYLFTSLLTLMSLEVTAVEIGCAVYDISENGNEDIQYGYFKIKDSEKDGRIKKVTVFNYDHKPVVSETVQLTSERNNISIYKGKDTELRLYTGDSVLEVHLDIFHPVQKEKIHLKALGCKNLKSLKKKSLIINP